MIGSETDNELTGGQQVGDDDVKNGEVGELAWKMNGKGGRRVGESNKKTMGEELWTGKNYHGSYCSWDHSE